jgi:hypothetical protein
MIRLRAVTGLSLERITKAHFGRLPPSNAEQELTCRRGQGGSSLSAETDSTVVTRQERLGARRRCGQQPPPRRAKSNGCGRFGRKV